MVTISRIEVREWEPETVEDALHNVQWFEDGAIYCGDELIIPMEADAEAAVMAALGVDVSTWAKIDDVGFVSFVPETPFEWDRP